MLWPLSTELAASGSGTDLDHLIWEQTVFTHTPGPGGTFCPLFEWMLPLLWISAAKRLLQQGQQGTGKQSSPGQSSEVFQ